MTYPGIGTTNPVHQLETTSNVTAESLEIYSDYTFFSSPEYDWARQLRLRVNTPSPSSSNVFVDMGLEKDDGTYFYISKPLSTGTDPKNNFRIYQNGKILINRTNATTRSERLQVEGSNVRVTGNVNVSGTTKVLGNVDINGDLHVTSFNQEKNYIVPEGMIVMWDGAVADIPNGWALVEGVSGYYLRSNPTQTSVQTWDTSSFDIRGMPNHVHNTNTLTSSTHSHNVNNLGDDTGLNSHNHTGVNADGFSHVTHVHNITEAGANTSSIRTEPYNNTNNAVYSDKSESSVNHYVDPFTGTGYNAGPDTHKHNVDYTGGSSDSGDHTHSFNAGNLGTEVSEHVHNELSSSGVPDINVPLTPTYRQIRLIKKLPYT